MGACRFRDRGEEEATRRTRKRFARGGSRRCWARDLV